MNGTRKQARVELWFTYLTHLLYLEVPVDPISESGAWNSPNPWKVCAGVGFESVLRSSHCISELSKESQA